MCICIYTNLFQRIISCEKVLIIEMKLKICLFNGSLFLAVSQSAVTHCKTTSNKSRLFLRRKLSRGWSTTKTIYKVNELLTRLRFVSYLKLFLASFFHCPINCVNTLVLKAAFSITVV